MNALPAYTVRRPSRSRFIDVRRLRCHVLEWGTADLATQARPPLLLLHGWMDVAASFQFLVDALDALEGEARHVVAFDWRGFGLSDSAAADTYWFPDYLGDLDTVVDALFPGAAIDLLGHSMGANVAMVYAGVRPARVRRLVNLEGFGMPQTQSHEAPDRYARWLDELKEPTQLLPYDSVEAVARRLMRNNPLLPADRAAWLAPHWAAQNDEGRWEIRADAAHKRVNPALYRVEEMTACWRRIAARVLWAEGDQTDIAKWWGERYTRPEFYARLAEVPRVERHRVSPAGHMLHHDQPQILAGLLTAFLAGA